MSAPVEGWSSVVVARRALPETTARVSMSWTAMSPATVAAADPPSAAPAPRPKKVFSLTATTARPVAEPRSACETMSSPSVFEVALELSRLGAFSTTMGTSVWLAVALASRSRSDTRPEKSPFAAASRPALVA